MQDGFNKVELNEYKFTFECSEDPQHNRSVVVIGESEEAAAAQAAKFAEHLGHGFTVSPPVKLDNFHVTYTQAAWDQLKASS